MANSILASYLLALDNTHNENEAKIEASFAGDDQKMKITTWLPEGKDGEAGSIEFPKLNHSLRFDVPPEEAIDYFKRKQIVSKAVYDKLSRESKIGAFYVSDVYKKDVLTAIHQEITDALETGQTREKTIKNFKDILDGAGHKELGDYHLESIFRNNMQTAYGVGRRRAMEDVAEDLPFWEYVAVDDSRTRPSHRALDGIIYPVNSDFWNTYYPPWDFLCRCSVIARAGYPKDYDHSKPNEDTFIAYDDEGLPAKAEYLNQVVDLKATKFVGIPKIGTIDEVFKQAAQNAEESRRDRDKYKTPQSVIEKVKEIRNEKVEVGHLFDADGNHLMTARGNEDEYEVDLPDILAARFEGGIDIHNHPPAGGRMYESFSLDDIQNSIDWNLTESLVVTKQYLYSMRPPKTGWSPSIRDEVTAAYWKYDAEILKEFYDRFRSGELSLAEVKDQVRHNVWKKIAKDFGLRYKRKRIN